MGEFEVTVYYAMWWRGLFEVTVYYAVWWRVYLKYLCITPCGGVFYLKVTDKVE
jgi:hypothetical protein